MNYFPLNDYVIVKKLEAATTTASGIILQTTQQSDTAEVIAIAESVNGLELGQRVMLRWSNALKVDGAVYAVSFKEIVTILA